MSEIINLSESENNNIFIIEEFDNSNEGVSFLDRLTPGKSDFTKLTKLKLVEKADISGLTIIAATFTYPLDRVYKELTEVKYTKQGVAKNKKVSIYLKDMPEDQQWNFFKKDFAKFQEQVSKKHRFIIFGYECYPELTKAGLIHVHASLYIHCEGWAMARSHAMAEIWVKISKGSMKALVKTNALGKADYAFAKCNDYKSWYAYITKEQREDSINDLINHKSTKIYDDCF